MKANPKQVLTLLLMICLSGLIARSPKTLVTGFNSQFPPYEFINEKGKLTGANVDLIKALAEDTGLKFKPVSDEWESVLSGFDHDAIQVIAGMIKTPELQQQYLFSIPHTHVHFSVFTRSNAPAVRSWQDLNNKYILMEESSVVEQLITAQGLKVNFLRTANFKIAMEDLSNGKGDAVILPKIQGYYYITQMELDNLIEAITLTEALPYCIALPIGYEETLDKINTSLENLLPSYHIRVSQNRWFGIFGTAESALDYHSRFYKYLLAGIIAGLVIITAFIYVLWQRIRQQKRFLAIQIAERNNYEKEYSQRHQLFVSGPIVFMKWNDANREMFDSISDNFRMFGYNPDDILSNKITYRSVVHPDDLERLLKEREERINKGDFNYSQIYRIICPPDREGYYQEQAVNIWHDRNYVLANENTVNIRWVYDHTVVIPDDGSQTYHFYGYLLDITAEKLAEAELHRKHQETQVAINTKDTFLTGISVEINSPLNALIGLSRKCLDKQPDEDQQIALQTIIHSSLHLKGILQEIHDFLNILKGSIGSVPQWYVMRDLFNPIIEEFQFKIASKNLAFEYNEFQPSSLVFLDADWFEKIIRILLDNAVKFTSKGKISLHVDIHSADANEHIMMVKVADTGVGIPEDKLQMILEPFSQADETFTRRYGGIGLGLSIARNLLIQMNGKFTISSTPDQGTTVTLRFPVKLRA